MRSVAIGLFLSISVCTFLQAEDSAKLIAQLKNKDPETRRIAAKGLGNLSESDPKVIAALIIGLQDKDTFVRRFSAQSLGNFKENTSTIIPALAAMLKNEDEKKETLNAAALSLGKLGPASFETLHALLKDASRSKAVKEKVIDAIGNLGKAGKGAVPDLMETLKDTELRFSSAVALGKIGTEAKQAKETLKSIVENKKERDKSFKDAASAALKIIGN